MARGVAFRIQSAALPIVTTQQLLIWTIFCWKLKEGGKVAYRYWIWPMYWELRGGLYPYNGGHREACLPRPCSARGLWRPQAARYQSQNHSLRGVPQAKGTGEASFSLPCHYYSHSLTLVQTKCQMRNAQPPCTRCKQRGLSCTVNRSLQMLLENDAS